MKVKQFIELLKNVNIFKKTGDGYIEKEYSDLLISIETDCDKEINFKVSNLNKEIENEIENLEVNNIKYLFNYSNYIGLKAMEKEHYEEEKVTVGELLGTLKSAIVFGNNTTPVEVIIKSKNGNKKWSWPELDIERYGTIMPWGWESLKKLEVESISEINSEKKFKIKIIAIED